MTNSSRAAFPARSPIPFIVHSICLAPALTPDNELATAKPRSLCQGVENVTLSAEGTLLINESIISKYSSGVV